MIMRMMTMIIITTRVAVMLNVGIAVITMIILTLIMINVLIMMIIIVTKIMKRTTPTTKVKMITILRKYVIIRMMAIMGKLEIGIILNVLYNYHEGNIILLVEVKVCRGNNRGTRDHFLNKTHLRIQEKEQKFGR